MWLSFFFNSLKMLKKNKPFLVWALQKEAESGFVRATVLSFNTPVLWGSHRPFNSVKGGLN